MKELIAEMKKYKEQTSEQTIQLLSKPITTDDELN